MRIINILAALHGASGLIMLAVAFHVLGGDPHVYFMYMAVAVQLSAAFAGLAIANRTGRLNLIAGGLLVGGATLRRSRLSGLVPSADHPHARTHWRCRRDRGLAHAGIRQTKRRRRLIPTSKPLVSALTSGGPHA